METKTLISSYDEINDTFVGKVDGKNGISADYDIAGGIFLGIDKNNFPTSVFVSDASKVLNTTKETLENSNVVIYIDCDDLFLNFNLFIEGLQICSVRCPNSYGIPDLSFEIDSNY